MRRVWRVGVWVLLTASWACGIGDDLPEPGFYTGGGGSSSTGGAPSGSSGDPGTSSSGGSSGNPSASGGTSGTSSSGGSSGTPIEPPGGTLTAGDTSWTIDAAGQSRSVRVHVPASIGDRKLPVVIALHGNGDSAANFEATSGLRGQSDQLGFVLLTPQGVQRDVTVPGAGTAPNVPWDAYNLEANNWDLQLLAALTQRVTETDSILATRISLYGFSQGGFMAFRAANAQANLYSCSAVMAAANGGGVPVAFARPIFISLQIGANDFNLGQARNTRNALMSAGHPHEYEEIAGLGHSLAPAPKRFEPLVACLNQSR